MPKSRTKQSGDGDKTDARDVHESIQSLEVGKQKNSKLGMRERILRLRNDLGSQKIAEFTGISTGNLSTWINGPSLPSGEALEKLAACAAHYDARFSASWLLTGEGEPYPQPSPETEAARAGVAQAVDELVAAAQRIRAAIDALGPALSPEQRQRLAVALAGPDPTQANIAATSSAAPQPASPPTRPPGDKLG